MQVKTTRIEIFSDAVMAIIITIMVLELKLPEFNKNQSDYSVREYVVRLLPHLGAYSFSFIMVAIFWTHHHQLFNLLKKSDSFLLGQNLFFLFWMSLIPLATSILGAYPLLPFSTALYGIVMLMTTFTLSFMRAYTIKKQLVHTDEVKEIEEKIYEVSAADKTKNHIATTAYLLSVALAFVSVYVSYFCFLIPIVLFLWPASIDEEKLSEKVIEKNAE